MAATFKMAALKDYISSVCYPKLHCIDCFLRFLMSMSMFNNPLNLNVHFCFIMADKMAAIFKMADINDLNYSLLS